MGMIKRQNTKTQLGGGGGAEKNGQGVRTKGENGIKTGV